MKTSAGLLVFRINEKGEREYLLVHPSGVYNEKAPFYIPKGEPDVADMNLEDTAIRETLEETGVTANIIAPLGSITYTTGTKEIHAFLAEFVAGNVDEKGHVKHDDWENDQKRFFSTSKARKALRKEMVAFIDRAEELLSERV